MTGIMDDPNADPATWSKARHDRESRLAKIAQLPRVGVDGYPLTTPTPEPAEPAPAARRFTGTADQGPRSTPPAEPNPFTTRATKAQWLIENAGTTDRNPYGDAA